MAERRLPALQWMSTPACCCSVSTWAAKQAVILHGRVRDPPGAEGRPLGRQVPGPAHLRPRPAVDDVRHALLSQACHQPGRRHAADRDALAADPAQRGTGGIRPGQPHAQA
jgi:hypothetical protein